MNKQNRPASKPDTESLTAVIAGLDSMRHGLCLVDSNFILIVANKAFADLLELPPDLIRPGSTTVEEIFRYIAEQDEYGPGNKDEQVAERMRQARLNSPSRFERVRPDGRVIEVVRTPVAGGGFISIFTDVTEKYRAEKALETSEASLAEAQKTTHIGSWGHGFGDMLYHWSDETSRILGYEPGKVAPSYDNYFQRIHPDDRDAMIRQFAAAKETRRDYRIGGWRDSVRRRHATGHHRTKSGRRAAARQRRTVPRRVQFQPRHRDDFRPGYRALCGCQSGLVDQPRLSPRRGDRQNLAAAQHLGKQGSAAQTSG